VKVDGNAIAGPLAEVFGRDVTLAVATCAGCHESGVIARTMVYATAMGAVARCAHCELVLMVLGGRPGARMLFSMPGVSSLELMPDEPTPDEESVGTAQRAGGGLSGSHSS